MTSSDRTDDDPANRALPAGARTDRSGPCRLTLLTGSFSNPQILRAQSFALVAAHLGHEVRVVTTQPGEVVSSIADSDFGRGLRQLSESDLVGLVRDETDVLCTFEALAVSLGLGSRIAGVTGTPLVADIADPEIEVRTLASSSSRVRNAVRLVKRWRTLPEQAHLAVTARRAVSTVSTPVLQAHWGGELVPHARLDPGAGAAHTGDRPQVAFVGTVREHKGVELLREAVASLAGQGWRLLITDDPPDDVRPWESWVGPLGAASDPLRLTAEADVVVVPSEKFGYARAQLPLKLVDAMLLGRAVVVSDVGPLPWAVGDAGRVFRASSVSSLVEALRPLQDPAHRAEAGARARALALQRYTVESCGPALARAVTRARDRSRV